MATYRTNEFRKGLKIQMDGYPFLMIECNFVKPGKGQSMYKCKLKNLIKGTVIDRTWKSDDSVEAADVDEIKAQYLYRQGDTFVFMDEKTYEQYEIPKDQVEGANYLKENMICDIVLFNDSPISCLPPTHVVLKVEYCEPGVRGDTATNVTKPVQMETGAKVFCPAFVEIGDLIKIDTRTGQYIERAKKE